MLTSHINCLEETGHHVEAHDLLLLNDCGIEQLEQRRHKSRNMHCSMFHYDMTFDIYLHICEDRAHIQRLTPLGPHIRGSTQPRSNYTRSLYLTLVILVLRGLRCCLSVSELKSKF